MIKKIFKLFRTKLKGKEFAAKELAEQEQSAAAAVTPSLETVTESDAAEAGAKKRRRRRRKKPATPAPEATLPSVAPEQAWDLSQFEVVPAEGKVRFHDLQLPLGIMHAIADLGFQYCSPIQAETLPHTLAGHDVIGQAQTGTGKTAAFLISLLCNQQSKPLPGKPRPGAPRALILAPTRELVMQITKEAEELAKYSAQRVVNVLGGMDYQKQRLEVSSLPVDVMVATPGRLIDFLRQNVIDLSQLEVLVIDEADRMLDMGFIPDVRRIVGSAPPKENRQTLFFSATLTAEVNHLASQWTRKAIHVQIEPEQVAVDSVEQIVYLTTAREKYTLLYNVITQNNLERVMIFANRRDETRKLTDRLKRNAISCAMLSGEVAQKTRVKTLEDFRNGKIRVLVATDVAGRGIHIDGVSHVINYTLPYEPENYVHRIGRTGRAGASGISISFACEEGSFYLPEIEAVLGHPLDCIHPDEKLLTPPPRGTQDKEAEKKFSRGPARPRSGGPGRRRSTSSSGGRRPAAGKSA